MLKPKVLAGLMLLATASAAQAAALCPYRAPSDRREVWVVSGEGASCDAKRVVTPSYECEIGSEPDHGNAWFRCGPELRGRWGRGERGFQPMNLRSLSLRPKFKLPKHSEARKTWSAPI